ncbi:MAG: hypothetical protein J7623_22780 [Chitinophaga sp.]|uniref:hypothetical protein n=1 Tax=Chitinophaga sp. TaxID=1869181 RepID=UPI001B04FFFE|nr:hypothetical protein [Chitinophaga sp.]MBO9731484.1 hypothetical protein [Chitinophaga sp.]
MKYLFGSIMLCLLATGLKAQSIFYDALYIKQYCLSKDGHFESAPQLFKVLKDYYPAGANIDREIGNNPFFKPYVTDAIAASGGGGTVPFVAKTLSAIGGLDVTTFANAIADLMIDRAKQELTIAFFNRFKKFAEENPEFKILFPKTTSNLGNLLAQAYPQMLPALHTGFFDDLKQLTFRLDDVLELPRYQALLANFPEVRIAIRSIRMVHELENGTSTAADFIRDLAALQEWKQNGSNGFKNMGTTIRFAAIFSEGLRYEYNTRIWVSGKDIKTLLTDEAFARIFMGLVYQRVLLQDLNYYFGKDATATSLTSILATQADNILLFQNKLSEFVNLAEKVQAGYDEIATKQANHENVSNEDIYHYINISIDIADYAFSIVKIFNEDLVADNYLTVVRKSNALYKDIYSSQYTQAVNDAVDILTEVHDLTNQNSHPAQGITDDTKKTKLDNLLTFAQKVKPYALFMANMVEAKDEDQVKAALENVILPVGSSSIKKYTQCNVSVQTYLGAFFNTSGTNSATGGTWSDKFGVTAPIGISWTPGWLSWGRGGAVSLFGALFDLGAVVDYKLERSHDATSTDPNATVINKNYKIELGQIFSPGVFAVYGVGANLPLSLGFGAQYGPGLSKIDAGNNTVLTNPSWRWNIFLAVDLPFFNLYNKPKHK